MTSIDFIHSGPHDALVPGAATEPTRSRLSIVARRIAGMIAFAAIVARLMALRYWIYLPQLHHFAG